MSDTDSQRLAYWHALGTLISSTSGSIKPAPPTENTWISHDIGFTEASLNVALVPSTGVVRVEIFMDGDRPHDLFDALRQRRSEIEDEVGRDMVWEEKANVRRRKIYVMNDGFDLRARSTWDRQHSWIRDMVVRFYEVFVPLLRNLPDSITGRRI
ncbi:DUF4268 domain-containing protein [Marinovum sp.]|uniref:DUF4268 domain-containing protein n=1 Tax=Marinovum sp. TaxID=2024839 RepID=UPI003A8FC7EE